MCDFWTSRFRDRRRFRRTRYIDAVRATGFTEGFSCDVVCDATSSATLYDSHSAVRAPDPVLFRFLFSAREPYMQTLCRER